jgi:hypothetical protein
MNLLATTLAAPAKLAVFLAQLACLLSLGTLCCADSLPAQKASFECDNDFRSVIQTNEVLLVAGISVIKTSNGKTYLLALGTAINQAKESPEPKAKIDTRKVAEAKARKQAAEFFQTEVHSETKLTEIKNSETISTNNGLKQQLIKLIKVREEIIVQRSQAILGGSKVVSTWFSEDISLFNAVVAIEIRDKAKDE